MPINLPSLPIRPRLAGYLNCVCRRDPEGHCKLSYKDYRVPIHISKPYWDGHTLLLNVMSPTAGMLEGDEVSLDIRVEANASLAISNPTSLRIHKMSTMGEARWKQKFVISQRGFLEVNPEWLILQANSSFTQLTQIDIDDGGELLFIEPLAPGRIAHGESFKFSTFRNRLNLTYNGQLAACEKHTIIPSKDTHLAWASGSSAPLFYVSIILASEKLSIESEFFEKIYNSQDQDISIGSSQLSKGPCWNIKALSPDPALLRAAIATIRQQFYESIGRHMPNLRRQ